MIKFTDEQLTQDVFKIYINSKSPKDFNEQLEEYIEKNKITKTKKYLRGLLEHYKKLLKCNPTSLEYMLVERTKKIHKEASNYKIIVEQLMDMSEEELEEFVNNNEITNIRIKFENYLHVQTNTDLLLRATQTLEIIKKIKKKNNQKQKEESKEKRYNQAIELFDEIVNNGFFDFKDFSRQMCEKYGMQKTVLYEKVKSEALYLRLNHKDVYKKYKLKLKLNAIQFFNNKSEQILDLINSCTSIDNYDIIDYYVNINLSVDVFQRLYNNLYKMNLIGLKDKTALNIFFGKYFDAFTSEKRHQLGYAIETEIEYENEKIREEEIKQIIEFMNKYNIPEQFFATCYKKYKNGGLDKYINQSQYKKSSM